MEGAACCYGKEDNRSPPSSKCIIRNASTVKCVTPIDVGIRIGPTTQLLAAFVRQICRWRILHQMVEGEMTPEFQRGWDAALIAARQWHADQAKKILVQSRRSRFPKNLEREADVHTRAAEMISLLRPDDV